MKSKQFQLKYCGVAVENGEMDVRELAPALLAVDRFFNEANTIVHGGNTRIDVKVKGSIKKGSIWVDLVALVNDHGQPVIDFVTSDGLDALERLFNWSLGTWAAVKAIGNRLPKIIEDDDLVTVEVDGITLKMSWEEYKLLQDIRFREALYDIVKPLELEGVDSVAMGDGENIQRAKKADVQQFIPPTVNEEKLEPTEYTAMLRIIAPVFKPGSKWKFSEGETPFWARITDPIFNQRVFSRKERFEYGDFLSARVMMEQFIEDGDIKVKRTVTEVFHHQTQRHGLLPGLNSDQS